VVVSGARSKAPNLSQHARLSFRRASLHDAEELTEREHDEGSS